jgi:hypothetical protein
VAGFVALAIPASGADTANNRYINVTGVGTVPVVPDAVRFNVTVSVVGVSNSAALSAASKAANAVRIALKNNDIALYAAQRNPTQDQWTESPKAYAQIYIDDAALGCPLINDHVDWIKVREWLVQKSIL